MFDSEGRVLLVREAYGRRRWSLPGGRLEPGELPHEAAIREAHEETGLAITPVDIIGLYHFRGERMFDVYAFRCDFEGDAAIVDGGEISDLTWADPLDLPTPMTNIVAAAVPDAIAGNRGVVRAVEWKPERHSPLRAID
jgi:8-oxo-dGTP pyrophosphatase MutT (NUDIX family)